MLWLVSSLGIFLMFFFKVALTLNCPRSPEIHQVTENASYHLSLVGLGHGIILRLVQHQGPGDKINDVMCLKSDHLTLQVCLLLKQEFWHL